MIHSERTATSKNNLHLNITQINNLIWLGPCDHPLTNSNEFKNLKIDVIINCAKEIKYNQTRNYIIESFDIEDEFGDPNVSLSEFMYEIADKIEEYVKLNKRIYIHCVRGMCRSPCVLIFYLMEKKNYTYFDAYEFVKKLRPVIDLNDNFINELRGIEDIRLY